MMLVQLGVLFSLWLSKCSRQIILKYVVVLNVLTVIIVTDTDS